NSLCRPPPEPLLGGDGLAPSGSDVVELLEDRAVRRGILDRALRYLPVLDHRRQRGARAADAALDGADRASTDLRGLLVGEAAGADQQQRFAPFGRQSEQGTVHVRQVDRLLLPGRGGQYPLGSGLVIFAAEAVAPHVGEIGIAQDHEGPGAHAGAGLEPVLGGPRLQQRFLHQVVRHVWPTAQAAGERAQMRHYRRKLLLEGALVLGTPFRKHSLFLAHRSSSSSFASKSLKVSGSGSSITES